jgi:uncharacterized membrane protein YeaQ/YmgE (transglycosylase-associated protein family)
MGPVAMNVFFRPVGILSGILAGILGKRIFELVWTVIDTEDAPEPKYREISLAKLGAALLLEGAIFRVLRGMADHGARHAFTRLTGEWPGQERPEPEED